MVERKMSLLKKLFGATADTVALELPLLLATLQKIAPRWEQRPVNPALIHARLADAFRAQKRAPPPASDILTLSGALDEEAWRRMALMVDCFDAPKVRAALSSSMTPAAQSESLIDFAHAKSLLTLPLLIKSEIRMEELGRGMIQALGAKVKGEHLEQSKEALERLDYERLLQQADAAKEAAQVRMEELKKRLEEQQGNPFSRGKW